MFVALLLLYKCNSNGMIELKNLTTLKTILHILDNFITTEPRSKITSRSTSVKNCLLVFSGHYQFVSLNNVGGKQDTGNRGISDSVGVLKGELWE